jgi:hypothetical protein
MGRGGADLVSLLFPAVFLRPLFLSRLGLSAAPADSSCLTASRSYNAHACCLKSALQLGQKYSSVELIFVIDDNTVAQCIQYIFTLMTFVI